jgi:galactitol-specific phosphotransferase system IIB component
MGESSVKMAYPYLRWIHSDRITSPYSSLGLTDKVPDDEPREKSMEGKKTILLVCAAGFATTSMLKTKIEDGLANRDIDVDDIDIQTATISNIKNYLDNADMVVTTLALDETEYRVPVVNGIPLLMGKQSDIIDKIVEGLGLLIN